MKPKAMKAVKCQMPTCKTTHKSTTGYCAVHVGQKHTMRVREIRYPTAPRLFEEGFDDN